MEREKVRDVIWKLSKYDMPTSLEGFRAFVSEANKALQIAESLCGLYEIQVEEDEDYDTGWSSLTVFYTREESDSEVAAREALHAQLRADRDAREAREYARLQAKFGTGSATWTVGPRVEASVRADLLDALKRFGDGCHVYHDDQQRCGQCVGCTAHAAIAKAEGRETK